MNIADIKPYTKNAKKHPKKQVEQVAASIKEFGFNQPVVVDKNGVLIVGHGRLEAAKLLGLKEIPTIQVDLTEEQAQAYRLADNKLNESEWDMKLVIEELKDLSEDMLTLTGFDKDLIIEPDEKDDEVPELPEEPQSKLGDLYELGSHRVLCGDSTDLGAVSSLMGDVKADMVFTDPPYNVDYGSNQSPIWGKGDKKILNDKMSDADWGVFMDLFLTTIVSNTKGGIYIAMSCKELGNVQSAFIKNGGHWSSTIIWNKSQLVPGRKDYQSKYEPILYGWPERNNHYWCGSRSLVDIWDVKRPSKNELHPTMKPIELVSQAITNSSKGEDIVLDIFLGSGSTLLASEKTGRICYGMELDPKYIDVIVQRYVDYTGIEEIKKNGTIITWKKTEK